jgi:hypothetical protein
MVNKVINVNNRWTTRRRSSNNSEKSISFEYRSKCQTVAYSSTTLVAMLLLLPTFTSFQLQSNPRQAANHWKNFSPLLDKHKEPFRLIAKSTIDASLMISKTSSKPFLKPRRSHSLDGLNGLSPLAIAAMAARSFNAYKITQLN